MRDNIRRTTITVTGATGGDGAATATATSSAIVDGVIVGVHVAYTGSPPSTTDLTIVEANNSPAMPILTLTNANTGGWFFPLHSVVNSDGSAITDGSQEVYVSDYVSVTIAEANNDDGATVTIVWASRR